jgi:beta-glucosidase
VDRETLIRTPKASYYWLQETLAARNGTVADAPVAGHPAAAADVERPHPVG